MVTRYVRFVTLTAVLPVLVLAVPPPQSHVEDGDLNRFTRVTIEDSSRNKFTSTAYFAKPGTFRKEYSGHRLTQSSLAISRGLTLCSSETYFPKLFIIKLNNLFLFIFSKIYRKEAAERAHFDSEAFSNYF